MKTKIVIFGITGDLSRRKLIPALSQVVLSGKIEECEIIGVSRRQINLDDMMGDVLASMTSIMSMDLAELRGYYELYERCDVADGVPVVIYLSVPPLAVGQIVRRLGEAGFNQPNVKLLLEKPFGVDEVSAHEMVEEIADYFAEENVYRIDHYLAKEMAQNIVAFRSGNALFAQTWNSSFIEKVEVIAMEQMGIEGRAEFYEQTGALRDVVQGHLMQLLALVITKIPPGLDWSELPKLRAEALAKLNPVNPLESVRGQYDGYRTEADNHVSMMETFVRATIWSQDPAWENVPFVLIGGKALDKKTTEVRIHFRKSHDTQANMLSFRIQPDEGVEIDLFTKKPGYDREFERQSLTFGYPEDIILPDAYEQVLVDAIRSDKSSFASSEEIIASWRVVQPLLNAWAMELVPLVTYQKGASITELE